MLALKKRLSDAVHFRAQRMYRHLSKHSLVVRFDITNRCNIHCAMCSTHQLPMARRQKPYYMPTELFARIAGQVFPLARSVRLAWSYEPTLHPAFGDILKIAGSSGAANVGFDTNGVLLSEDMSREILLSGIDQISLSLDGWSSQVFEAIRVGAKRDLVYGNVHRFLELREELNPGFGIEVDFTLTRENAHELLDVVHFALESRCGGFNIIHVDPCTPENPQYIGAEPDLCNPLLTRARDLLNSHGAVCCIYGAATNHHPCREPWELLLIDCYGKVHGCSQRFSVPFGDFTHQSFKDIWDSHPFLELRADLSRKILKDECATCYALACPVVNRP